MTAAPVSGSHKDRSLFHSLTHFFPSSVHCHGSPSSSDPTHIRAASGSHALESTAFVRFFRVCAREELILPRWPQ